MQPRPHRPHLCVNKHTGELIADCFREQRSRDRGVYTAGQRQQHLAVAHLASDGRDRGLLVVLHGPVSLGAADLIEEVAEHKRAVLRVVDLRVILHAVKTARLIRDRRSRTHLGGRRIIKKFLLICSSVFLSHP